MYKFRLALTSCRLTQRLRRLVEVWHDLQQNIIDSAVSETQWRQRLTQAVHASDVK